MTLEEWRSNIVAGEPGLLPSAETLEAMAPHLEKALVEIEAFRAAAGWARANTGFFESWARICEIPQWDFETPATEALFDSDFRALVWDRLHWSVRREVEDGIRAFAPVQGRYRRVSLANGSALYQDTETGYYTESLADPAWMQAGSRGIMEFVTAKAPQSQGEAHG